MKRMLLQIWDYREFIYSCVRREFLARYQGSLLGAFWSVFQPLAMILVYTLIFSNVMRNKLSGMEGMAYSYSIYLCAGVLPWGLFTEMLMSCTNVFLANGNLLKKLSFPRICLPVITICSAVLNFIIGFVLFLLFLLIIGHYPWQSCWVLLPLLATQIALASAFGIGLGVINVFFRDVGQMLNILLQFWFWFTPIVYPAKIVPESLVALLKLNPMFFVTEGYQTVFLYDRVPNLLGVFVVFGVACLLSMASLHIYRQHVGEMVDEL